MSTNKYGLALGRPGERVDRFAEGLAVLDGLLNKPTTSFAGHYYQLSAAECEPKPVQSPLPLLIGVAQPRMLRLTARYASQWNQWSYPGGIGATSQCSTPPAEREGPRFFDHLALNTGLDHGHRLGSI